MSRPRRFETGILWWFTVTGAVVPWLAGIGTKLYLDYHGQPTFSWSYFLGLEIVLVEIIFSLWFTSPFFLLGLHARRVLSSSAENPDDHRKRIIPIMSGFIFGLIGEAVVFVAVFREFDILLLFTPLPLFYLFFIIVGWATGAGYVSLTRSRKTAN